ncbi:hypothetical protein BLGI_2481 [Brevibacillus laterosporus GI-9]|nr:hypothetical protein BLGI_2481 [Brevibacillus laterosporus GI-9]
MRKRVNALGIFTEHTSVYSGSVTRARRVFSRENRSSYVHTSTSHYTLFSEQTATRSKEGIKSIPFCTLIMKKEALFPYRKGLLSDHACTLLI